MRKFRFSSFDVTTVQSHSLRNDRFSAREERILTQNFEVFLAHRGIASTDKEKIQEIVFSPDELVFRQTSGSLNDGAWWFVPNRAVAQSQIYRKHHFRRCAPPTAQWERDRGLKICTNPGLVITTGAIEAIFDIPS